MNLETVDVGSALITYGHATDTEAYSATVETDSDAVGVIAERNGDHWLRISNDKTSMSAVMDRQAMQALWRTIGEALEVRGVAQ